MSIGSFSSISCDFPKTAIGNAGFGRLKIEVHGFNATDKIIMDLGLNCIGARILIKANNGNIASQIFKNQSLIQFNLDQKLIIFTKIRGIRADFLLIKNPKFIVFDLWALFTAKEEKANTQCQ